MEAAGLHPANYPCHCPDPAQPGKVFTNPTLTEFAIWAPTPHPNDWAPVANFNIAQKPWPHA